jgi:hypothetical protein
LPLVLQQWVNKGHRSGRSGSGSHSLRPAARLLGCAIDSRHNTTTPRHPVGPMRHGQSGLRPLPSTTTTCSLARRRPAIAWRRRNLCCHVLLFLLNGPYQVISLRRRALHRPKIDSQESPSVCFDFPHRRRLVADLLISLHVIGLHPEIALRPSKADNRRTQASSQAHRTSSEDRCPKKRGRPSKAKVAEEAEPALKCVARPQRIAAPKERGHIFADTR